MQLVWGTMVSWINVMVRLFIRNNFCTKRNGHWVLCCRIMHAWSLRIVLIEIKHSFIYKYSSKISWKLDSIILLGVCNKRNCYAIHTNSLYCNTSLQIIYSNKLIEKKSTGKLLIHHCGLKKLRFVWFHGIRFLVIKVVSNRCEK